MSLISDINTDARGNIIVHMKGGLNYETTTPLKSNLTEIIQQYPMANLTLDLHGLDFVGSSGIGQFVELINELGTKTIFKLINVKPEFLRVFKRYHLRNLENMVLDLENDETMEMATQFASRKRTFEN